MAIVAELCNVIESFAYLSVLWSLLYLTKTSTDCDLLERQVTSANRQAT